MSCLSKLANSKLGVTAFVVALFATSASMADELLQSSASNATIPVPLEIILIDASVEDAHVLTENLASGKQVVTIGANEDPFTKLLEIKNSYQNISALHVVSHGTEGGVYLGNSLLTTESLNRHVAELDDIAEMFSPEGDILFYGCDVAGNEKGKKFIARLAELAQVDVASSDDKTGARALSGDWALEYHVGDVASDVFYDPRDQATEYSHVLAVFDFTGAAGNGSVSVTQTTGSVTLTLTDALLNWQVIDGIGTAGTTGTIALTGAGSTNLQTFAFSSAVNLTSIRFADLNSGTDFDVTFTPTGGANSPVNVTSSDAGATVALGWTGVTSFTVTENGGDGIFSHLFYDDIVFTSAASPPAITSATYNASNGSLVVTGTDFTASAGAVNDVIANKFSIFGEGGANYTLTNTPNVEISSATEFTLALSSADRAAVNQMLNKNGTASTSANTYDLDGAAGFIAASASDADTGVNGITVSGVPVPTITSASYNASSGVLAVTGAGLLKLSGVTNDIDVSKLTLQGEGGATRLLTSSSVEITDGSSFSVTLNVADKAAVNQFLNKDGTSSTIGTAYNLAAAEDWAAGADAAVNVVDATGNAVTVSNVAVPTITSATYDASSGVLVVTGTDLLLLSGVTNDIDVTKLTLLGEGGATRTLTSANVEITNSTSFSVTLNGVDKTAVNQFLNKDGTSSTSGTSYNLAAAEDWAAGADAAVNVVDATGNAVTVSNVAVPTITSATYDATSGVLTVTGTDFLPLSGAMNDIDVTKLTLLGEGNATRILTSANVEITNSTSFSVTLNGTDKTAVNQFLNKDGTSSTSGTSYNLAAAEDWAAGADAAVNVVDATGNAVTVGNVAVSTITSATYDATSGVLAVTGTGLLLLSGATNDIDVTKLTLLGEGNVIRTLTSANIEITNSTSFSVTLNGADKAAVNQFLNKNGTSSTSGTSYNLAAAEDWAAGADAAVNVVDATNGVTVSNVATPMITSAVYDYSSNVLTVTGSGLLSKSGANNDINALLLTFTGEGGASYNLTGAGSVDITSGTEFSLILTGADLYNVEALLNNNGATSAGGTTYNLAAAEDWAVGANAAVNVVDTTNGVAVSNYTAPAITSATYDWTSGQLVVTGTNFVNSSGAANDLLAAMISLIGEGGSYTLTSSNVDIANATAATLMLNAMDKLNTHGLLNRNGTTSGNGTTYNLAAADNWLAGSPAAVNIADLTGNGITVSNVCLPTISSAAYDSNSGLVTVTGSCLFKKPGADNDIDISAFTFTGGTGNQTYQITSASLIEITSSTSFSFTLSGADKTAVDALLDQTGGASSGGSTYNIAVDDDWLAAADAASDIADSAGNTVSVSVSPKITSATYDVASGNLVVTGTDIQANGSGADIDVSMLTLSGEGSASRTLTTTDVEITNSSGFTVSLNAADKAAVNLMLNKNGVAATDGTTYNLAAADDWNTNVTTGDTSDASNAMTVSNVAVPAITSATYDATTGVLVVSGSGLTQSGGANNDIAISLLTLIGEGNTARTLTTTDVEITNASSFSVTLNAADKTAVNLILNKAGTTATGGATYNLAAAENWANGADAAVTVADLTNNAVTVSNVSVPTITSATYSSYSSTLVVTGSGFLKLDGADNDIDLSMLTIKGQASGTYTLTATTNVELDSDTQFTVVLSGADINGVNALINKDGLQSVDMVTYNLAAAENWASGAEAAVNVVDATGNGITATVNDTPAIANLSGDAVNYSVGSSAVTLDNAGDASLTDADSADLNGGNITVAITVNRENVEDQLLIGNIGSVSTSGSNVTHGGTIIGTFTGGTGVNNLVVLLNAQATRVRVEDLLRAIQYTNTNSVTAATAVRTVQLTVNDGDGGNATSATQSITVNLLRAPIIDLDADNSSGNTSGGYNASFTENGGVLTVADADASIMDDGTFKSLTVTLNNRLDGALESLSSSAGTGGVVVNGENITIAAYNAASGELLITVNDGSAAQATMEQLLTSIRYNNISEVPDTTARTISFVGTDNADNAGPAATATVSVTALNDVPIGGVTISGEATQYKGLVADTSALVDVDGLGSFNYQWRRGGSDIGSATLASYTLTAADIGKTITITVSYTDGGGIAESVTSPPTSVVERDLDMDGIKDSADTDIDGDGMLNTYEDANGLDKENAADRDTDLDGDGVSNYDESVANSNADADDQPPLVTAPVDVNIDATGLFTNAMIGSATAIDAKDGSVTARVTQIVSNGGNTQILTSNPTHLSPGVHVLTWAASDLAMNQGTATQTVNVTPMVSFSKNQVAREGDTVTFEVILNGAAVTYPVTVPYTVGGTAASDMSDHNLVNGSVEITTANLVANVTVVLVDDGAGEGTETLVVTMDTPSNAVQGPIVTHTLEIREVNVAPLVSLTADQGSGDTRLIAQGDGNVMVSATVVDSEGDSFTYDWGGSGNSLIDSDTTASTFTFDPSGLTPGLYNMDVLVSDGTDSQRAELLLNVIPVAPILTAMDDSDGDGITDDVEGVGDSDGDGVPNYLDHVDMARNVVQERDDVTNQFLMETEAGLVLKLGSVAFRAGSSKTEVSDDEIKEYANNGMGATPDEFFAYSGGLFDFKVEELPIAGQQVRVVLAQFAAIPANAVYRKLMSTGWQDFVIDANNSIASAPGVEGFCPSPGDTSFTMGLTEGHWCVQLTIEDGGPNDADGEANKTVQDPGGVAVETAQEVAVVVTGGGGGAASFWALLMLAALLFWPQRNKHLHGLVLSSALLLGVGNAQAESFVQMLKPSYIGLSYLSAKSDERSADFQAEIAALASNAAVTQTDIERAGYTPYLGYQVNEGLAFELAYVDLGDVTTTLTGTVADANAFLNSVRTVYPVTASGWTFSFVVSKPLTSQLKMLAKAGAFDWRADYTLSSSFGSRSFEKSGLNAVLGFALEVDFITQLPIRLGWNKYQFSGVGVDTWEIGVGYRF